MSIGSKKDLDGMRKVGRVVAATLREMRRLVRPGMTTAELDAVGLEIFRKYGARSAPRLVYNFPGTCCISVNDEAVHGVPGSRVLRPGDVAKIDVTAELNGYIADSACTVVLPPAPAMAEALARCAEAAFFKGLSTARAGNPMRALGRTVEQEVNAAGFKVLRDLGGHGVGKTIHEAPHNLANYDDPRNRGVFVENTVVAIEPIISSTSTRVVEDPDGWTLRTKDGSLAAHFEHTVLVTRGNPIVLTAA
jgi:methionyl aminopeptidase